MNARPNDPLLGSLLDDRYRIVRRIARGGMATVFEARDMRLARTVAVKVMHPGLDEDGDIAARFDTEARAAAVLQHPNVVAVFDQGRDEGRPYIVMEYVRGITLRQLITLEAPFAAPQALQLFEPVVSAVAAAHGAGIIHRDLKPENVLISERGHIKVADFGLARNVTGASVAESGVVIGTVSYIAPELLTRGTASQRSDVYSLGIMLYELLTGLKPHRGGTPVEVAYAHVHKSVPAPSMAPRTAGAVPAFLDTLVRTTTARPSRERQTDARVLLTQVQGARAALATDALLPAEALMRVTTQPDADAAALAIPALPSVHQRSAASPASRERIVVSATSAASASTIDPTRPLASMPARQPVGGDEPPPGRRIPMSPYSPPRRPRVVGRPTGWSQDAVHRRRRLAVVGASVLVVFTLLVGSWALGPGRLPATPRLAGLEQRVASEALASSGLSVQFLREYSETVPLGVAVRSEPSEGVRLQPGSVVVVYISGGPQLFDVPALKGKSRDQAVAALASIGLAVGSQTDVFDAKAPAGTVVSQGAAAGTSLRHGATVDLVVSKGPEPIALVDWTGKPAADAKAALSGAGLRVKITMGASLTVPKGSIVSQSPAPGTLKKGDAVTLVVSSGPGLATVADVRKLDAASATAELHSLGFVVVQTTAKPSTPPGTVTMTSPKPGARVQAGSTVTITVG